MHLIQIRPFNFVKWSKFFKSDENAGWNKSAGRNFFQKIIKVQDGIRLCRLEFSEKLISCAACLLDTLEYVSLAQWAAKLQLFKLGVIFHKV